MDFNIIKHEKFTDMISKFILQLVFGKLPFAGF